MKSLILPFLAAALVAVCGCGSGSQTAEPSGLAEVEPPTPNGTDAEPKETDPTNQGEQDVTNKADAMALYRQAQALMKDGKQEEGYETAKRAMQQFVNEDNDLAWILLESVPVEGHRVDVHFNMGPDERAPPEDGIIRPLSFRVWSTGADESLVEVFDFEIGRVGGDPLTAAIGKTDDTGHANYGILPVHASYEMIINAVLKIVRHRTSPKE